MLSGGWTNSVYKTETQAALPSWEDQAHHRDVAVTPGGSLAISEHAQLCGRLLSTSPLKLLSKDSSPQGSLRPVCGRPGCPHPRQCQLQI